ncbi:MAG: serine hydrolase domain-containing protein [Pseudolysinimonas sp.]|uniref:serine hydrolase domain-containing protein n=1 Tax=Pseudolysinimonas sp. TaxID=2680009 RepID=UPI003C779B79
MHLSRLVWVVACASALALLAGCAATPPTLGIGPRTHAVTTTDKRPLQSDAAVDDLIDAERPGCSAAVGIRGEVVWAGATGIADLTTGEPVTTQTRFDMASVSKQFTATAILMLQRDGALTLADPISAYVDGLPSWGRSVTLDQLMHHTSRVPDYWTVLDRDGIGFSDPADHARILNAIRRLTTLETDAGYSYSNSNYVLLAEVVARVSGQPLPEFLADRIFTPLGLDMELSPGLVAADVALSYDADDQFQPPGWTAYGAIGIFTTPSELVRWGDQYRAGDIIQDDFAVGASDEGTGEFYAAGMDIEADGDLNHNGRFGGYTSTFTVSADRETTIAVMCNGHAADRFGLADALWVIWAPPEEVAP